MSKSFQIAKIALEEYFVYRVNFLLWRLRNFTQILVLYFLWQAVIPEGINVFGYNQARILTYILGTSIIQSLVFSSRSADVAGLIASGDLANFLIKPISFLSYCFIEDVGGKILHLFFSTFEILLLIFLLKPPLIIQTDPRYILLAGLAVFLAIPLYFLISFLLSMIAFWAPENPWPPRFIFSVLNGFLAGSLFPLDILPPVLFNLLKWLPFSSLLFSPLNIYLGKLSVYQAIFSLLISIFWLVFMFWLVKIVFQKGLRVYAAWGR